MSNEEQKKEDRERLYKFERQLERISSWLRSELGYDSESQGNVNRLMNQAHDKADEALSLLRGKDDQMGIVAKTELLFRSWHILLSVIAALGGYIVRMVTES